MGFGGWDAFDTVGTGFVREVEEDGVAREGECGGAEPPHRFVGVEFECLGGPAGAGGVLLIHGEDVGRPDPGFVAADAGADLEDDACNGAVLGVDEGLEGGGDECVGLGFE
mgnify:CR=1 FL=1